MIFNYDLFYFINDFEVDMIKTVRIFILFSRRGEDGPIQLGSLNINLWRKKNETKE
jgi:hypothetical protein